MRIGHIIQIALRTLGITYLATIFAVNYGDIGND